VKSATKGNAAIAALHIAKSATPENLTGKWLAMYAAGMIVLAEELAEYAVRLLQYDDAAYVDVRSARLDSFTRITRPI
jgi:hypothetical protein